MSADALPPGSELFGYRIDAVVGRGGMGTVYRAMQLSLGRTVALKVLHPARIRSPQQVEAFLREARAAARLNHPHLVLVHDAHADAARGIYCYSMEYVPGRPLTRILQERGPLPRATALPILLQAARALGHAHRHGLVHRDVKPDNLLITDQGLAKLADLGLVRDRLEGLASPGGGRVLTLVGTPEYSAPEQCRNPARATPASDVYSLGAVLCFMLLGRPPFSGDTVIDLIVRAATEDPHLPATMPDDCRRLCQRMLAHEPAARFPDGDAVVAALEALARGEPLDADDADDDTVATEPVGEAARPRRRLRRRMR